MAKVYAHTLMVALVSKKLQPEVVPEIRTGR